MRKRPGCTKTLEYQGVTIVGVATRYPVRAMSRVRVQVQVRVRVGSIVKARVKARVKVMVLTNRDRRGRPNTYG